MPRMLADGKKKFAIMPTAPANINAITLTEAAASVDYSKAILASDFDMGFAASDRNQEKALDVKGNAESLGNSNFSGGFSAFRGFLVETGLPDEDSIYEELWLLIREKQGTHHILIRHNGKDSPEPFTVDDEVIYVEWVNDLPASPGLEGDIKHRVEGAAQRFSDGYKPIVAGAGG